MTEAVKLFIQEMDKRDVRHQEVFEAQGRTVVPIGFGIKSTNITIHVIFDDNDYTVAIRCFGFLKISEDQFPQALVCCNELNQKKRWVKFYIDNDGEINIEDDAIVDNITAGSELLELVMRMAAIADEAYPILNRAIWS